MGGEDREVMGGSQTAQPRRPLSELCFPLREGRAKGEL